MQLSADDEEADIWAQLSTDDEEADISACQDHFPILLIKNKESHGETKMLRSHSRKILEQKTPSWVKVASLDIFLFNF